MTQVAAATKTNLFALIGFFAAFLIPVVGIVFGAIATRQIRDTGEGGRGLSRAAIIIGIAGAVFQLAFFIVWLTLFFSTFRMGTAG